MKGKKGKVKSTLSVDDFISEVYPVQGDVKQLEYELGIDEAGRGPVLGSMVYSALWWPKKYKQKFTQVGFADSKQLNESERDQLFAVISKMSQKIVFYQTEELTAEYLSNKMLAFQGTNLNLLSHNAAVKLIRSALSQGFNVTDIYVDTVGDPNKYKQYIRERISQFGCVKNVVVQPKADRDHKVVSASSICAKVTRDKIIREWQFSQNLNFIGELGSGYPSDPTTKLWLQNNKNKVFGFPTLIRFSWNTCSNSLQAIKMLQMEDQNEEKKYRNLLYLSHGIEQMNKDIFKMVQ